MDPRTASLGRKESSYFLCSLCFGLWKIETLVCKYGCRFWLNCVSCHWRRKSLRRTNKLHRAQRYVVLALRCLAIHAEKVSGSEFSQSQNSYRICLRQSDVRDSRSSETWTWPLQAVIWMVRSRWWHKTYAWHWPSLQHLFLCFYP